MSENLDKDCLIFDGYIQNSGRKNIIVDNASLTISIPDGDYENNIFNILKQDNSVLRVNNEGVLIFQSQSSFPEGQNSIIYKEGNFYVSS